MAKKIGEYKKNILKQRIQSIGQVEKGHVFIQHLQTFLFLKLKKRILTFLMFFLS